MFLLLRDSYILFSYIIPDIPEKSITDRSESSSLSKALPVVHVGLSCIQGIFPSVSSKAARPLMASVLSISSPISSVAEGTTIKDQETQEVRALLMCSDI